MHACGSGGTFAGCNLAHHLAGIQPRHVAVIIEGTIAGWRRRLGEYVEATARRWSVDVHVDEGSFELIDGAGLGYAINTEKEIEFIVSFARRTGIFLDPVYTGKAFAGLLDLIEKKELGAQEPIVFLHTGGGPGLFALSEHFSDDARNNIRD